MNVTSVSSDYLVQQLAAYMKRGMDQVCLCNGLSGWVLSVADPHAVPHLGSSRQRGNKMTDKKKPKKKSKKKSADKAKSKEQLSDEELDKVAGGIKRPGRVKSLNP